MFNGKRILTRVYLISAQGSGTVGGGGQSTDGPPRLDLIPVSDMLRFNSHCNQVASRRGTVAGHCCLLDLISTLCTPTSAFQQTEKYA